MKSNKPKSHKNTAYTPLIRVFLPLLALSISSCSQQQSVNVTYVANAANNNVEMINLDTGESVYKLYTGTSPWRLMSSADNKQLWIQNWYSETTTVVDLRDHEVKAELPFRGPGTFTQDATQFVTYSWPKSELHVVSTSDLTVVDKRPTEITQVYDIVARQDGKGLYMTRFDPVSKGRKERYQYMLFYPYDKSQHIKAPPASLKTGLSPTRIERPAKEPFLLTTDNDTNGLSIVNLLGDVRSFETCPTPIDIGLSKDEKQLVVICWEGQGARDSEIMLYKTDFTHRPWPQITLQAQRTVQGGLVRVKYDSDSEFFYVIDQTNKRIVKIQAESLRASAEYATGDMPSDMVIYKMPKQQFQQLASNESKSRRLLKSTIANMQAVRAPFKDISWTENSVLKKKSSGDFVQTGASGNNAHEHDNATHSHEKVPDTNREELLESVMLKQYLHQRQGVRTEAGNGVVKIANAGSSVSIMQDGRFWFAPEQSLAPVLWRLPNISVDDAIRQLAGDIPGSDYMRSGLAMDLISEVNEGHHKYWLIGSQQQGMSVAQLWVNADTGLPTNLIDKFPVVKNISEHAGDSFSGLVETKFYDYEKDGDKYSLPAYQERTIDGKFKEEIRLSDIKKDSGVESIKFSVSQLGGKTIPPQFTQSMVKTALSADAANNQARHEPFADEYINHPFEEREPYVNNPPVLGRHLPYIADWGVHAKPVPLELQLHNLKDGGVVIQYQCPNACAETVAQLTEIVKSYPKFVLLAPYPLMQNRIAVSAWGKLQTMDDVDNDRIHNFIRENIGINHHGKNIDE